MISDLKISSQIPNIHLKDIGTGDSGVTPSKAVKIILAEIYKVMNSPDVMNKLKENLQVKGVDIESILDKKKELEDISKNVKGNIDTIRSDIKKELDEVNKTKKEIEDAADKLKQLFR